jgi:hypothetical protein
MMRSHSPERSFVDLFYGYKFLNRLNELASECNPSSVKKAALRALIHNLREFSDPMVSSLLTNSFLHHFAGYYSAFHDVSDAITGPAFIVNWIRFAELEIQQLWM